MEQQKLPPGFRFSPTDEELVVHYLKNRACNKEYHQGIMAEVDIYKHEPWDLPEKSSLSSPDPVWYFFNCQDKRHSYSARINRTTSKGYWKATGKDRKICSGPQAVGTKKTLIYYEGRAPSGKRTDWIMHEYKLDEEFEKRSKAVCSVALCRIRKKGGPGPRNGEQFGASVYPENGEWVEDADDDADENVPKSSQHRFDIPGALIPGEVKVPKEEVTLTLPNVSEGPTQAEIVDANAEFDLQMLLEYFTNNPDVSNVDADIGFSPLAADEIVPGQHNSSYNMSQSLLAPSNIESILGLQGTDVHDLVHPTYNEEHILGELFHLADGSQCNMNQPEYCNAMMPSEAPIYKDSELHPDGMGSNGTFGDYIEMNDMESPLDLIELRSPSYHGIDQQALSCGLFDDLETVVWPANLHEAQMGEASQRLKLQIRPPLHEAQMGMQQSGAMHEVQSNVPVSNSLTVQIGNTSSDDGRKLLDLSSDLDSDSDSNSDDFIQRYLPKNYATKVVSSCTTAGCKEIQPQLSVGTTTDSLDGSSVFRRTTDYISKNRVQPSMSDAVSFVPSLLKSTSGRMNGRNLDCEAGLGGSCDDYPDIHGSHQQEAGLDCSRVLHGVHTSSDDESKEISQLVSKVRVLTLGSHLVELESNLSSTFDDKVFALGKPVTRLFPSKDCVNPYRSLRSGAISSLCHLGLSILVLCILFLGLHMLAKWVLSLGA